MNRDTQKSVARVMAKTSAVIVVLCVGFLLVDTYWVWLITPSDKIRVVELEESVKMEALVAIELTSERERQTFVSLERDLVNETVGTVLLVAGALFLTAMKWLGVLGKQPELSLEKLVALKALPATVAKATAKPKVTAAVADSTEEPEIDLSIVDDIINKEGRSREAAIPILQAIQSHFRYLPDEALKKVCEETEITPAQIAGTSSFYSQFRSSPVGKHIVKVCHGTACHVSGITPIHDEMSRYLSIPADADTDPKRLFTLDKVACLGCCSLAPVIMIDENTVGRLTPASACEALHDTEPEEL